MNTKNDDFDELKKKIQCIIKENTGAKLNIFEKKRIAKTIDEFCASPEFRKALEQWAHKTSANRSKPMSVKTDLITRLAKLTKTESFAKQETKKGFNTRFQKVNETTIQETNEFGNVRTFFLNKKTGVWEVEGKFPLKAELRVLGKGVFNVTEIDRGIRTETLYSPARKIQETFIRGTDNKDYLHERTEEDIQGTRDRQLFNEKGQLVEERVSKDFALKKLIVNGKVLFDNTKSTNSTFNTTVGRSTVRRSNTPTR